MNTRAISTSIAITACDVCGRTLLRGERAEIYVGGGSRHTVCELCTSRAIHTGWVREGTIPDYGEGTSVDRRRSLLGRLRSRRQQFVALDEEPPSEYEDEFEEPALAPPPRGSPGRSGGTSSKSRPGRRRRCDRSRRRAVRPHAASRWFASLATSAPFRRASSTRSRRPWTCSTPQSTRR